MKEFKYVYGPVPSRRLGISLGISPIPKKVCNYSCIYCQLGRTTKLTNSRSMYFKTEDILGEFKEVVKSDATFDVVTIVGEGEPTLFSGLGDLLAEMKKLTDKPLVVITNGALLYDSRVQSELMNADIVLPSMDAYDEESFKKLNRPHGSLDFGMVYSGLKSFSEAYTGQLWIEIMLVKGINDSDDVFYRYKSLLEGISYDRLYLNTPVRPPAESYVSTVDSDSMSRAVEILGGVSIDLLSSEGFHSEIPDDYEALLSIIKRHPMNQYEVSSFLSSRSSADKESIFEKLSSDEKIEPVEYKGYTTYRLR